MRYGKITMQTFLILHKKKTFQSKKRERMKKARKTVSFPRCFGEFQIQFRIPFNWIECWYLCMCGSLNWWVGRLSSFTVLSVWTFGIFAQTECPWCMYLDSGCTEIWNIASHAWYVCWWSLHMRKLFSVHCSPIKHSSVLRWYIISMVVMCAACVWVFMQAHVICLQHLTYTHQTSYWYDILYAQPLLLLQNTELIYHRIDGMVVCE